MIVPGNWAYPTYLGISAYICQPIRSFRPVIRMGFYLNKAVMPVLPKIERVYHAVDVTEDVAIGLEKGQDLFDLRLADLIRWRIADPTWEPVNDFDLTSAARDAATERLPGPIPH